MTDENTVLEVDHFVGRVQSAEVNGDQILIKITDPKTPLNTVIYLDTLEAESFLLKHPLGSTVCVKRYAEVSNPPSSDGESS